MPSDCETIIEMCQGQKTVDTELIEEILCNNSNLINSGTLLHHAVDGNKIDIVRVLLGHQA